MPQITDENTVSVDEFKKTFRQKQPVVQFPEGSDGEKILKLYKRQMDRLDLEIDEMFEQRLVETATAQHLERIGARYGVQRKTGEDDDKLRLRIKAAQNVAQSRGTYRDIAEIALDIFDTDPSKMTLVPPSESGQEGTGIIRTTGDVIDNSPFTTEEITSILSDGAIAGHRIKVEQEDAFTFGDPDNGWGTDWGQTLE